MTKSFFVNAWRAMQKSLSVTVWLRTPNDNFFTNLSVNAWQQKAILDE